MTTIEICATFMAMRLKLSLSEEDIKFYLSDLLELPNRQFFMKSLIMKFQKSEHLLNILGSWMGPGEREILGFEEVVQLLGEQKLLKFSSDIGVSMYLVAVAFVEVLPVLIDRYLNTAAQTELSASG